VPLSQLPKELCHNQYIKRGYRPTLSLTKALKSIFHFHNETLNIWTHLSGVLIFFFLMYDGLSTWLQNGTLLDKFLFLVHVVAAQMMMLFSVLFHTFYCLNHVYGHLARLDLSGIGTLIVGSYYFPLYYTFHCDMFWFAFYVGCISVLGFACIYHCWARPVHNPGLEWLRAIIFIALGLFGVVLPIPHGIYLYGIDFMWPIIWRLALMGITYISGALIYVAKAPERYRPGKFDFHLNSHVIWHLFVLIAALIHYQNHFFIYSYRMRNQCPPSLSAV